MTETKQTGHLALVPRPDALGRPALPSERVNSKAVGGIVFACVFGGALLGIFLGLVLPKEHLSSESTTVVRMAMAMISLMSAVVVGLLIASAKSSFDIRDHEYRLSAANIVLLDRAMAHYGAETTAARDLLRQFAESRLRAVWPEYCTADVGCAEMGLEREAIQDMLRALSPKNDAQRWLQSRALQISTDIQQLHWLLIEQSGSTIQWPFLAILVFWLTMIFMSFGLSAPPNATVITTLFVCSLSISGAIYLILQLHQPFDWPMKISSAPLRTAIDQLGQ
jgi:hypothetical protein